MSTRGIERVFLISEYYPPHQIGGAELSVERLAQTLAACGVRVTVITINLENFKLLRSNRGSLEVVFIPFLFHLCSRKWQNILFRSWLFYLFFVLMICAFAIRRRPAVLHAQNKHVLIPSFLAGKILKLPVTFTVRDTMLLCPSGICLTGTTEKHNLSLSRTLHCLSHLHKVYTGSSRMSILNRIWATLLYADTRFKQWVMRRCTAVIFVSHGIRRLFEENGLRSSTMDVIYNIPPDITPSQNIVAPVVSDLTVFKKEGGKIVLTVGKLSFGKGTQFLLDAVPSVVNRFPDVRFVFAGRQEVAFHSYTPFEKNIMLLGFVPFDTVARLYELADVVCQPSIWPEPFSRTLLESMAFGKPVVATSVGGTPEIVVHEETGILVPPRDSESLASAICYMLGDRDHAVSLGDHGREQLDKFFNPTALAQQYLEHYGRLL